MPIIPSRNKVKATTIILSGLSELFRRPRILFSTHVLTGSDVPKSRVLVSRIGSFAPKLAYGVPPVETFLEGVIASRNVMLRVVHALHQIVSVIQISAGDAGHAQILQIKQLPRKIVEMIMSACVDMLTYYLENLR